MEMLAAFIREPSRPQWPPADPGGQLRERSLRPDVQAAMTAVGRRLAERDTGPVDLARADLTGADLAGADLAGADLGGARLTGADLSGADLTGANLADTDLAGADLTGTNLTRAELTGALWPLGWPVPAGWTRHAGSGQLIPAGAGAEKTAAQPAARLSLPEGLRPPRQAGPAHLDKGRRPARLITGLMRPLREADGNQARAALRVACRGELAGGTRTADRRGPGRPAHLPRGHVEWPWRLRQEAQDVAGWLAPSGPSSAWRVRAFRTAFALPSLLK